MFNQKTIKNKPKATKPEPIDSIPSFIRKTYEILEENKFPEYIDWNAEGNAIIIKMPSEFAQKVLPTYFKHNNLTSFVRQLNMYNFHKKRTQNLDHIYFHELFQRGKKHLLKEIKRKNHDMPAQTCEKSPIMFYNRSQNMAESASGSQTPGDLNSLSYENQFLKKLYNDAVSRAANLENQMKELTAQNQNLWSQLCHLKGQGTPALTCTTASGFGSRRDSIALDNRQQNELTMDQLPMTMGDVCIPPLKLENLIGESQQYNASMRQANYNNDNNNAEFAKNSVVNVNSYLNFCEDSTNSSDGSPSLNQNNHNESDKDGENYRRSTVIPQLNGLQITPQTSLVQPQRGYHNGNLLKISRQDISLGQLLNNWNEGGQENGDLAFTEQKENVDNGNFGGNILGKRGMEVEQRGLFCSQEPSMKRNPYEQCGLYARKGVSSGVNGDDKEILQMAMRRESEFNEDCDISGNMDLMDFNGTGFYSWTKSM